MLRTPARTAAARDGWSLVGRFRSSTGVWLIVSLTAFGLVSVPATTAVKQPKRYKSAAQLPALKSAAPAKARLKIPTGRSSALETLERSGRLKRVPGGRRVLNSGPPATTASSPDDGATVTTTTPTLSVNAVTDPDADPVSYRFKVTTKSDAETGTIVADTLVTSTSFTVPDGALKDGVTYFWHTYTSDATHPAGTAPGWVRSFRVDLRLGQRNTFPFDSIGPASVNLANGNLVLGASTAQVGSLAGPIGVNFVYNSLAPAQPGLIGTYTVDANANRSVDSGENPSVVRRDPEVAFDWGTGSPSPGMPTTNLLGKWVGNVTVPSSGTYLFGAVTSDGVKIRVNNTLVVDSWTTQAAGAPVYGSAISLTGGSPVSIQVDWFKGTTGGSVLKLYVKSSDGTTLPETLVPPTWLSSENGSLPRGWTMSPSGGAGLAYVRAEVSDQKVVFVGPDGDTHVYTSTGTGYTPPKDEDGILARDTATGLLTLDASDGTTYVFDAAGTLTSATSSGAMPQSHRYTWATPSGSFLPRLTGIVDPVSNRTVTLRYGGDSGCPGSSPSGFDSAAPSGMLCSVELWDGRATKLWYVAGRLARIENPGAAITDFAYDTNGRIAKIRDSLAADMVAAALRADDDTTRTLITYDTNGRVNSITLGEPTAGAARPGHDYDYVSATEVQVDVDGLTQPNGWWRKVTMDTNGRQLTDTDATNRTTTYTWDLADRVTSTVDPAGLKSTTIYDHAGRPIESYGPAPSAWFGTDNKPLTTYVSQVAKNTTAYDENIKGLDALYFNNGSFAGAPVAHQLGVGDSTGAFNANWTTPPPGITSAVWSARFTGEITMDYAGTYTFTPNVSGRARIYLDDILLLDTSVASSVTYNNTSLKHRIRIEYTNQGPNWQTYNYTGAVQTLTVPAGVTSVGIEAWGAQGGYSVNEYNTTYYGALGGLGGYAKGTVSVTAGQTLYVYVGGIGGDGCSAYNGCSGGLGGFNGGGSGFGDVGYRRPGGGGGASDVRYGGQGLDNRLVVAGGGGGAGSPYVYEYHAAGGAGGVGGSGAGAAGQNQTIGSAGGGGGGAGGGAGGAGGAAGNDGAAGQPGQAGSSGQGGVGGYSGTGGNAWGGGGGGGYIGGGGGGGGGTTPNYVLLVAGGGGGGGGSNYVSGTNTASSSGARAGHGQVVLAWIGAWSPATIDLHWTPPGGADVRVPGTALSLRYGLVTSSIDADGKKMATEYGAPETGLATKTIADPAGLALTSTMTYEAAGSGFFRPTSRRLPKGAATEVSYTHYGATETRTDPCVGGSPAVNQAGLQKLASDADPDGVGSQTAIQRENVYDAAGRRVASRVVGDPNWSCVAYDSRDRVVSSTDRSGASSTMSYATAGTVTATFPDSAGTTRSTVTVLDLLGRGVRYTDEVGTQHRTEHDQAGRVTATYRTFMGGSETQVASLTYDAAGRVLTEADHLSSSVRTSTLTYDGPGRLSGQARPNGIATAFSYSPNAGQLAGVHHDVPSTVTNHSQTYNYTGGAQSWTVPVGATSVTAEAWGAAGGYSVSVSNQTYWGGSGGLGGYAKATLAVTPGESLQVNVGGKGGDGCFNAAGCTGGVGGFNGGGSAEGTAGYRAGGGGGGGSDIRRGGTSLGNRVLVAGGGGGGGVPWTSTDYAAAGGNGGGGGSGNGLAGQNQTLVSAGGGAGGTAGGAGGAGGFASNGNPGNAGQAGTSGQGGGGVTGGGGYEGGSGAGGGGYVGGGSGGGSGTYTDGLFTGGGGGGGGGGSNYVTGTNTSSSTGVRSGPGQVSLAWSISNAPQADYLHSLGGRVTREIVNGVTTRQRDFTYDGAGRLVTTVEGGTTRRYAYDANSNRCGLASSCESAWVYDNADRIKASPYASAYTYDGHGNVTATTGTTGNPSVTISYDANDHATVINDGTTTVTETLAPSGRVLRRVVTTNATSAVVEDISYGYAGPGDSPAYSRPTAGGTVTTYLLGMGGLTDVGGTGTWSLHNAYGDVLGTTNAAGTYTAAPQADEFGVGTAPSSRLGWLGQQQRHSVGGASGLFRMGVRLYDPALGRFLQVDPIEGGSCNDYDYVCGDPINKFDLAGTNTQSRIVNTFTAVGAKNYDSVTLTAGAVRHMERARHGHSEGHFGGDVNDFVQEYFFRQTLLLEYPTQERANQNSPLRDVYRHTFAFTDVAGHVTSFDVKLVVNLDTGYLITGYIENERYDHGYTYGWDGFYAV
jgi:RHS repeat-associated protein